ncbi:septum formation initiator family protein [Psychrobacillus sp.]|uniref:FtsB family cell division protein n=1 Tax=Psychrobacillus sp. TaxID=1871623 RepID=UPI0028BD9094|nr:septum formation initiator family protein [Psychrobacillus sp.]
MENRQRNTSVEKQIPSINADYVRSVERQDKKSRAKKVRLYRRLAVFTVMSIMVISFLVSQLVLSNNALDQKIEQKEKVVEELAKIQEEQEMLSLKISKLNDDEYIGKLLRKDYFLSEEGEIIFSLPESDDK